MVPYSRQSWPLTKRDNNDCEKGSHNNVLSVDKLQYMVIRSDYDHTKDKSEEENEEREREKCVIKQFVSSTDNRNFVVIFKNHTATYKVSPKKEREREIKI